MRPWYSPPAYGVSGGPRCCQSPRAVAAHDDEVPCASVGGERSVDKGWWEHSQSRMFFSSGTAQMKGGGAFCIARYSCMSVASGEQPARVAG